MANPSLESQAFAPIDYSGYGNVAQSMVHAGKGVDKAMNDWSAYENAKDKERMRQQAVQELRQKMPILFKEQGGPLTGNESAEQLGMALHNVGAATILYQQMKDVEAQGLPADVGQLQQVAAGSSDARFKQFVDDWQKRIQEGAKTKKEAEAMKGIAGAISHLHPGASEQELARTAVEKAPESVAAMGSTAKDVLLASGQKQTDIDKLEMQKARLSLARDDLHQRAKKMMQDKTNQDWWRGFTSLVTQGKAADAQQEMFARAKGLRAEGEQIKLDKGNDAAAAEKFAQADALERAGKYSEGRLENLLQFANDASEYMKVLTPSKIGENAKKGATVSGTGNPSPAQPATQAPPPSPAPTPGAQTPLKPGDTKTYGGKTYRLIQLPSNVQANWELVQ